jgi:hypothetical protein
MSVDPRIDPKMPHADIVQRVADIIRDHGPILHRGITKHLPQTTGLTSSYTSYVLKKLKAFGMVQCKGGCLWSYVPAEGEAGYVPPKPAKPDKSKKVMLKHMGSYRVKTHDGRSFDRMEFHRRDMTWSNRTVTLDIDEIAQVAFVPDHAAYKSGTRHLDIYAHPFSDIGDCIIPKLKPSDEELPKWVNPIRARSLGVELASPYREAKTVEIDFGDPRKR